MLSVLMSAALFWGCIQEMDSPAHAGQTEVVQFSVASGGNDVPQTKGERYYGYLSVEEDSWDLLPQVEADTKTSLLNQLDGFAGVFGYINNAPMTDFSNLEFEFDGDELVSKSQSTPVYWKNISSSDSDNVDFFVYAPREEEFQILKTEKQETDLETGTVKLSYAYSFEYTASSQQDIVVAHAGVKGNNREPVTLEFNHIFTAIRFYVASDISNVVSLKITGVNDKGTYTFGKGWSGQTKSKDIVSYTCGIGDILMMIPQSFAGESGANVVLRYKESADATETKTISASLDGQIWKPGRLISYTVHKQVQSGGADSYIYLDLAAGNVTINSTSYSGKVFVEGMSEAQEVSGNHLESNKYYVFQSNPDDADYFGGYTNEADFRKKQNCMIPNYPGVTYNGQSWADFITNNANVEQVIEVWDDGKYVRGESFNYQHEGYKGVAVVRDAGRTHTKNYILVQGQGDEGNVVKYDLTIDDIYSVIQEPVTSANFRARDKGGIAYIPSGYTELKVNFIGDNRMGCLHINNRPTDKIILEGTGSLTVADADFMTREEATYSTSDYGDDKGYISNFWNSAIGNNTNENDPNPYNENVSNLYINSGVIFAGTTKAEDASAIGGGGNGDGQVFITGGKVTAVATSAGTAIGGGMGHNSQGGKGYVVISGGNIYAYNHANRWGIASSAIGGGGSSGNIGSDGNVTISGGSIYAYSELGTAIGGGSSSTKVGGNAVVKISGGYIVAKTGNPISNGIGGGTGGTTLGSNGGSATIEISGNPIIRTGSVGGGMKKNTSGTIGSAAINISGGDIQAQFVMAKGAGVAPKFVMSGGNLRNSATDDDEYLHVQPKGGAVYMEDGTLTMSGGSITHCSAVEGGAIYVNGGNVTIDGDASISGNLARGGNGGAICINNGNFTMQGGASITGNAAQYNNGGGSGGGVYVSSSNNLSVSLLSGSIMGNSADRYGGGISVDMGSSSGKKADIVIGTSDGTKSTPTITGNGTQVSGGGLYAEGIGAALTIYSGTIFDNTTSGYTYNPDIANEGGMVTLVGDGDEVGENGEVITEGQVKLNYVEVTYDPNQGKINGSAEPYVQKIVTSTNSLLVPPTDVTKTGYDFVGWNTRNDGLGDDPPLDRTVNLSGNLYLYAKWQIQR